MNSPPQLRGVFSSPNNVSNFKPTSQKGGAHDGAEMHRRLSDALEACKEELTAALAQIERDALLKARVLRTLNRQDARIADLTAAVARARFDLLNLEREMSRTSALMAEQEADSGGAAGADESKAEESVREEKMGGGCHIKKCRTRRRRNRRKKRTRRRRRRSRSHRRKRGSGGVFSRRAASTAAPADLRPVPLHRERIPRRIRHGHDDAALRDRSRALLSPIGAAKEEAADLHTVPLHRERIPPSSMIAFSAPLPPHGQRHALLSPTDGGRRRRRTRRRRRRR